MTKKKTSKAVKAFEAMREDPVFVQMGKTNLIGPEDMRLEDFIEETNKVTVEVLKAINGCHRNIVGSVLDVIAELYIRRAGE